MTATIDYAEQYRQECQTRKENMAKARALLVEVAVLLPGTWTFEGTNYDSGHVGYLVSYSGASLSVFQEQYGSSVGRLEVRGDYDKLPGMTQQRRGNISFTWHKINVSVNRPAKAVAGDIIRRLLPEYLPDLEKVRARLEATEQHGRTSLAVAEQLAAVLGSRPSASNDGTEYTLQWFHSGPGNYGDITVSGERVAMKLHGLTVSQAQRIAAILAESK